MLARATKAHRAGDQDKALTLYTSYLAQVPGDALAWSNLGTLHWAALRFEQALRAHRRAFALDPNTPAVLNNFANVLSAVGQYDLCVELREKILSLRSFDAAVQKAQIGRAYRCSGDLPRAIAFLESALGDHPGGPGLELQLSFALLGDGKYERGFDTLRSRWRTGELTQRSLPFPRWDGEDLAHKTVLVLPEQGLGDLVLMLRFLPWLAARAGRVVCLVRRPLERLLTDLEGAAEVVTRIEEQPEVDVCLDVMDLPRLGLRTRDDIPAPTRLTIPEDSLGRARTIVRPHAGKFKVGVNWSGSVTYKGNPYRSFEHTALLPLTDIPDVQPFSLYKGPLLDRFRADGSGAFIIDAASGDRDLADCAALMTQMDLILTCDTATAHVAGSLGLPTWVPLHWDPYWVFAHSGETTPWYPSMRLFRQRRPMDWADPLGQVEDALRERVDAWRAEVTNA